MKIIQPELSFKQSFICTRGANLLQENMERLTNKLHELSF